MLHLVIFLYVLPRTWSSLPLPSTLFCTLCPALSQLPGCSNRDVLKQHRLTSARIRVPRRSGAREVVPGIHPAGDEPGNSSVALVQALGLGQPGLKPNKLEQWPTGTLGSRMFLKQKFSLQVLK